MPSRAPLPPALAALPCTPEEHFKLWFYAAVLRVLTAAVVRFPSWEELFARFPFLAHYNNELAASGVEGLERGEALARWVDAVLAWEEQAQVHLPLRALRSAVPLAPEQLTLLATIGLQEEDPRFGAVFAFLQGTAAHSCPTAALLASLAEADTGGNGTRSALRRLHGLGLIQPVPAAGARQEWSFEVPAPVWDAMRGECHEEPAAGLRFIPVASLVPAADLIVDGPLMQSIERLPGLLSSGTCDAIVLRGARHNGRGTVAGAVARAMGRGVLEMRGPLRPEDERCKMLGPMSALLHAIPLLRLDLGPGDATDIPRLKGSDAPLAVVIGRHGGVTGTAMERAITVTVPAPGPDSRARHWARACGDVPVQQGQFVAERFRLTSGNIHRAARIARVAAGLALRGAVAPEDVQEAARTLNREALDTLAVRVPPAAEWTHLALAQHTRRDLDELERRCRLRERLAGAVGPALAPQLSCGVRALLTGPSGVGKSLAAKALAHALQMDLYAVNIAAILNKYVGETEKNLNELFTRAEELDVMLLLDEGDALLTARTAVSSANDRYANFETNFLLQRIESFDGIIVITTNAVERIDTAFQRRLDMVVEFTAPEPPERLAIWDLHLPRGHRLPYDLLAEIASRCAMTGGQIRNAVLHAGTLALDDASPMGPAHVCAAVEREYRKAGAVCPLQATAVAS